MSRIPFSKYSAAGNDFILIDNRKRFFPAENKELISSLTHRRHGIGADGIILLEKGVTCDYRMRIFNPDGQEATMCGNGLRALVLFLEELGQKEKEFFIETGATSFGPYHCSIVEGGILTRMSGIVDSIKYFSISTSHGSQGLYYLNTGTPHTVLFLPSLEGLPIETWGRELSFHPLFAPQRTNVNFASHLGGNRLSVRTFEKGVEGETLACGTGVMATGLAAALCFSLQAPLQIAVRSGDILTLFFKSKGDHFFDLALIGPAKQTFHGFIYS